MEHTRYLTLTLDRNARASGYQQAFERSPYDISQLAQQNQLVDMERLSSQQPMQHSGLGSMVWHPDSLGRDAPAQMVSLVFIIKCKNVVLHYFVAPFNVEYKNAIFLNR